MKKTIIEMVEKCQGGKAAVAGFLGLTEQALNNRLYQTKGQRFTEAELLAVQHEYGLTDYVDEICRRSGGVFVPLPDVELLDNVELSAMQVREVAARGMLFAELEKALADGEINRAEEKVLRRFLHNHLTSTQNTIESVIALHKK